MQILRLVGYRHNKNSHFNIWNTYFYKYSPEIHMIYLAFFLSFFKNNNFN